MSNVMLVSECAKTGILLTFNPERESKEFSIINPSDKNRTILKTRVKSEAIEMFNTITRRYFRKGNKHIGVSRGNIK